MKNTALNTVKVRKPNRNFFDHSHDFKFSCKMGSMIPVVVQECVPGDKWTLSSRIMLRFAPMLAPTMHRITGYIHYFFVPNRLVWDGWEDFITGKDPEIVPPSMNINSATYTTYNLCDYMGLPTPTGSMNINPMPFAAYQMIWSEYYRNKRLQDPVDQQLSDGVNTPDAAWLTLRRRCWEQDYFTACLPTPQAGDTVDIPLGTINGNSQVFADMQTSTPNDGTMEWLENGTTPIGVDVPNGESGLPPTGNHLWALTDGLGVEPTTILELRRAFKIQEWLERTMLAGGEYKEHILAMFGVRSSDARLQRPEYIGGMKTPVIISEVLQTAPTDESVVGTMAGHGVMVDSGKANRYYCEEHGYIIGILTVMPETGYFQGVPRHFGNRFDVYSYLWPLFAHIGEQAVLKKEIYEGSVNEGAIFGYLPRYQEYRGTPNRIAGDFKSTLLYWHLARKFDTEPSLNEDFVECVPSDRIFAVENDDNLWCVVLNNMGVMRALPVYGEPFM